VQGNDRLGGVRNIFINSRVYAYRESVARSLLLTLIRFLRPRRENSIYSDSLSVHVHKVWDGVGAYYSSGYTGRWADL